MEELKLKLKSYNQIEYNDEDYYRLFELENYTYRFLIYPKTKYWRFGIRLSQTSNVHFFHPTGRYKNPAPYDTLEDLHLGVGDYDAENGWSHPNKLHLAQYYLIGDREINTYEAYNEYSEVQWVLKYDKEKNVIVSIHSSGDYVFEKELPVKKGYNYFKVFAWADNTDFEIDCTISQESFFGLAANMIEENKKTQSTTLDLSKCSMEQIPRQLSELVWLEELIIADDSYYDYAEQKPFYTNNKLKTNSISFLPKGFRNLKNLKKFVLGGSINHPLEINDLQEIKHLQNLKFLSITFTTLADISFVSSLKNLDTLICNSNRISDITSLAANQQLQILDLGYNEISDISAISELTNIRILRLDKNKILNIEPLEKLTNIEKLRMNNNFIENIDPIAEMIKLKEINFNYNQINNIDALVHLKELEVADISYNQIRDLKSLSTLSRIRELYFSYNRIETLEPISKLERISVLRLRNTLVSRIATIINFPFLKDFDCKGCPIEDCPADIYETNDILQLKTFFKAKQDERISREVPEKNATTSKRPRLSSKDSGNSMLRKDVKLIILGNSNSGKTNLVEYLETGKFSGTRNTTHGLEVHYWLPDKKRFPKLQNIAVSIWDFGGQEYYHGAYRLFLSTNALYLLIWCSDTNINGKVSTRLKENDQEVNLESFELKYWLDTIKHYGSEAEDTQNENLAKEESITNFQRSIKQKLIAVQNKVDDPDNQKRRITQELHNKYLINDSFHVSLKVGSNQTNFRHYKILETFLTELEYALETCADKATIPSRWQIIRDAIIQLKKTGYKNQFSKFIKHNLWIVLDDFKKACDSVLSITLSNDEVKTIAQWLDRGGIVVYFPKIEKLKDKIFLRPDVLAEKIYEVLNETVRSKNGDFSIEDISDKKSKDIKDIFIELAMHLELIFPHPTKSEYFLAPQYLPDDHPIEDLFKIASNGAWKSDLWIRVPLFFYKKILHGLLIYYAKDPNTECRYFWKHGIMFTRKENNLKVLIKGLYPNCDEHDGVILLGVEKDNSLLTQKTMQSELFAKCLAIMMSKDKNVENFIEKGSDFNIANSKNLVSNFNAEIQVSYDGVNYINYDTLLQNAAEPKVKSDDGRTWIIMHHFSSILPKSPERAKKVFLSYSHQNTKWLVRLRTHLAGLRRAKQVETWDDKEILPGDLWDHSIRKNIEDADIFILLLSADFIASEYIWENELPFVIKNYQEKNKTIIPILFEPIDLGSLSIQSQNDHSIYSIGDFEIIPKDDKNQLKAVSLWENQEQALTNIVTRIREAIKK